MKKFTIASVLRLLLLALAVSFIWCVTTGRLSSRIWNIPIQYHGDPLYVDAFLKTALDGDFIPLVKEGSPRLAAPYGADWFDYPTNGKFLNIFLALLTRLFGLGVANNLGMMTGHILSAISFYICCRILRRPRIWSFAGAIIFAFAYYTFCRLWGHIQLAYYFLVPFGMLNAWFVMASKRMKLGDSFSWICLLTAVAMTHPYYLNMYCQFLCFALAVQYFGERRKENIQVGLISLAVTVGWFLILNSRAIIYPMMHGKNQLATARNYFETELYALKPMELFIPPPTHHIEPMASLGALYRASAWVKGEMFSPYLGVFAIVGLAWIFVEVFLRMSRNGTSPRRFPAYAPQIVWIILYATIGGLNCVAGILGFQLFRGSNRYSIFIFTIILFFLVSRISSLTRKWSRTQKFGVATLIVIAALYDQLPVWTTFDENAKNEQEMVSDKAFGAKLESKLPPGAMIFQIPVMGFPEGLPIRDVSTYEMFRPYLWTKTMRFSYGAVRGRTREEWQYEIEKLPPAQMAAQLEKYGFSALYLNRRAFADDGEGIISQFAATGRAEVIDDDVHEQACILLKPSPTPDLPHTDDRAQIVYASGWAITQNQPLENQNWTSGDATIQFFSEPKGSTSYNLRCVLASIVERKVVLEMDGRQIWSGELTPREGAPADITVLGNHGKNTIHLITDAPPAHPKESPYPLSVAVMGLRITKTGSQE